MSRRVHDSQLHSFAYVLERELDEVGESRKMRTPQSESKNSPPTRSVPPPSNTVTSRQGFEHHVLERASQAQLVGLCLSGGGIRSATFNLGVLQALADREKLHIFDYLSTVSGGGYIGGWLAGMIKSLRERDKSLSPNKVLGKVIDDLQTERKKSTDHIREPEPEEIRFLRDYSNYLTPRLGMFSSDTWSFIAAYLRNLLLNLSILCIALLAALLVPYLAVCAFDGLERFSSPFWLGLPGTLWLAFPPIVLALFLVAYSVLHFDLRKHLGQRKSARQPRIPLLALIFALLGAWFIAVNSYYKGPPFGGLQSMLIGGLLLSVPIAIGKFAIAVIRRIREQPPAENPKPQRSPKLQEFAEQKARVDFSTLAVFLYSFLAGSVGGGLFFLLSDLWNVERIGATRLDGAIMLMVSLGVPTFILLLVITLAWQLGLGGRGFAEESREWWNRFGGWMLLAILFWIILFGISLYGPTFLEHLWNNRRIWLAGLTSGWMLSTISALTLGKKGTRNGLEPGRVQSVLFRTAPTIFVVGLLVLLSWLLRFLLRQASFLIEAPLVFFGLSLDPDVAIGVPWEVLVAVVVGLLVATVLLSYRVDVNLFSMHLLYRNRLVRAFLGASNRMRNVLEDRFTHFAETDDFGLHELVNQENVAYPGPFPIFNTALNLIKGKSLAWQQRKAASFIMTPLYAGYDLRAQTQEENICEQAFRASDEYAGGLRIGTAMSISGAAASPSMGSYTFSSLSFLMTIFNVRLGCWLSNPGAKKWKSQGPAFGLFYLLTELLGLANAERDYVYLSDGGHFENLGLYELVKRRCAFIVVSDASRDPDLQFSDLGNAIERCRTDFGIEIDIDLSSFRRAGSDGGSMWHCAVGKIRYGQEQADGILVYIKASVTGDESEDIRHYAASHPQFPHESTSDQWFSENQFECYRKLGHHVANSVFADSCRYAEGDSAEELFTELRRRWHPPRLENEECENSHRAAVRKILGSIRNSKALWYLDPQLYTDLYRLGRDHHLYRTQPRWFPKDYRELREGFTVCRQMMAVMEDVYWDLDLENHADHPDNRGWMNLFRRWAWSRLFRFTWAVTASDSGGRFQIFCKWQFGLDLGRIDIGNPRRVQADKLVESSSNSQFWRQLERDLMLDLYERRYILNFLRARGASAMPDATYTIYPASIHISDPCSDEEDFSLDGTFPVSIGFILSGPAGDSGDEQLLYMRIRSHLQRMGLGRKLVVKAQDHPELGGLKPAEWVEPAVSINRFYYPNPDETAAFIRLFDSVEKRKPLSARKARN